MFNRTFTSASPEQTHEIAKNFADAIGIDSIVLISGVLGAGKTTFCKGFLSYWNIKNVTSPSYNIVNEYYIGANLDNNSSHISSCVDTVFYHIDLYRISNENTNRNSNKNSKAKKMMDISEDARNEIIKNEILALNIIDIFETKNSMILIEWPDLIMDLLPIRGDYHKTIYKVTLEADSMEPDFVNSSSIDSSPVSNKFSNSNTLDLTSSSLDLNLNLDTNLDTNLDIVDSDITYQDVNSSKSTNGLINDLINGLVDSHLNSSHLNSHLLHDSARDLSASYHNSYQDINYDGNFITSIHIEKIN